MAGVRLARVRIPDGSIWLGRVDGDAFVPLAPQGDGPGRDPLREAAASDLDLAGRSGAAAVPVAYADCAVLAPVAAPQKILAIGLNYRAHAAETGAEIPLAPVVFAKMPSSLVGPGDAIRWQEGDSRLVDYEAELAFVIGRRAHRVNEAVALTYVLGLTCCNDVSARDAQRSEGQWVRSKSFDTFCPLGPEIVTLDETGDPQGLRLEGRLNSDAVQDSSTADMIFSVAELVARLSATITLEPGDVVTTGTPAGVGASRVPPRGLVDGDTFEVELERVGILANPVTVEAP